MKQPGIDLSKERYVLSNYTLLVLAREGFGESGGVDYGNTEASLEEALGKGGCPLNQTSSENGKRHGDGYLITCTQKLKIRLLH